MTTTSKTTLGTIPSVSSKRKLKFKKQMSESAVRNQTLHPNGINQLDIRQIRRMSDSSLMSLTNSFHRLNLQTKDVTEISQSSSNSDLSQEISSKMVHSKLLKKRLKSLDRKELKNFSQSFPIYDREKYNADGSLRTMYRLPSMEQLWGQAKLARYLRTPRRKEEDEKEDLLSKQLYPVFKYQTIGDTKYKNNLWIWGNWKHSFSLVKFRELF